jgi:hypothetical protein
LLTKSHSFVRLQLQLCFMAFPLAAIASRQVSETYFRLWLDVAWVLISALILMYIILSRKTLSKNHLLPMVAIIMILVAVLLRLAFSYLSNRSLEIYVIPIELKIFLYTFLSVLTVKVVGVPTRLEWTRAGVILAIIILSDTVIESISVGGLARPQGSGEVNYDAMLLAIAFGFIVLQPKKMIEQNLVPIVIILFALFATQSRTMLLSVSLVLFLFSKINFFTRLIMLAMGVVGVYVLFVVRDLAQSFDAIDRYWMWVSGLNLILDPEIFFFGVPPGLPLNIDAPEALQALWDQQTENLSNAGIFPFNFHAFWLRFALNFGAPLTAILLIISIAALFKTEQPVRRYLIGIFILSGFTMGSIYLSNVAVPFLLALASTYRKPEIKVI